VRLNGRRWDRTWFTQADIARGGTLDFDLGPAPSSWGANGPPPSLTQGTAAPFPLTDAASLAEGEPSAHALFDDDSRTTATGRAVEFAFDRTRHLTYYTLTSGPSAGADPSAWIVKGTNDGRHWKVLDLRWNERFPWRSQTRPFALAHAADVNRVRIEFASWHGAATTLSEVELLSDKAVAPSPLAVRAEGGAGRAGDSVPVTATVVDSRTPPAAGTLTATGWTTQTVPYTPGTPVTLDVAIPPGTAPGSYPIRLVARSGTATARVETSVTVIGDTIAFTPGTDAETARSTTVAGDSPTTARTSPTGSRCPGAPRSRSSRSSSATSSWCRSRRTTRPGRRSCASRPRSTTSATTGRATSPST
jgi:hypothetical protein